MLDLGRRHGRPVRGYHLGEVFGKCINLLLEEKGCTDGTELPFVHDKGELLHRGLSASKFVLSGYAYDGRNKATTRGEPRPTNDLPSQQALADLQEQPTLSRSFPPV